jgi:alanine racemase
LSPIPAQGDFGLVPAMTLRAAIALAKAVDADTGVSYGHRYRTAAPTTLALVPLGYADGIPRAASNVGPVQINGARFTVSGTVCMDQFVVDVGGLAVVSGDEAVLFGPGRGGEPTAQDWADAVGTIHYEIVTRIGARVPRTYQP